MQRPAHHIDGHGCPRCAIDLNTNRCRHNTSQVIEKFKLTHGDKYIYSEVDYESTNKKVKIICSQHGPFWQRPSAHFAGAGCPKCSIEVNTNLSKVGIQEFISRARNIHNDKYDYSKSVYNGMRQKLEIVCKTHGSFWQYGELHIKGGGCPKCANKVISESMSKNPVGWSRKVWSDAANRSKRFDGFKLYLILMGDPQTGEYFLKVGRTFLTLKNRFTSVKYQIKPIYVYADTAENVYTEEQRIKSLFASFKMIPDIFFTGRQECFSITALDALMTEFEKLNGQSHELLK